MAVYATRDDRDRLGVLGTAYAELDPTEIDGALAAASAFADDYLAKRFTLPLTAWSDSLRLAVVRLADWQLMTKRGFNPEDRGDVAVRTGQEDSMKWLRDLAKGELSAQGIVDSTPTVTETRDVVVRSKPKRGW